MVAGSWLFAYAYFCVFVAGEVKRPDKTLIGANFFAILVPAVLMIWTTLSMYNTMPFDFISATARIDNNGGIEGYNMPFLPSYMSLAYVAHSNWFVAICAGGSYMLFCFWYVALSYLAFPRIIFAWGMDRMGPTWFTFINPRWASPVKNYILCFVLCQAAIALYSFWLGRLHAGSHGHGHGDRLGVGHHHRRGAHLPLREALQGHLGVVALQDLEVPRRPARQLGRRCLPRVPRHPLLLPYLHPGDARLQRPVVDPVRHRLDHRCPLVLLLGGAQQEGRRRRRHDLRGAAAGVIPGHPAAVCAAPRPSPVGGRSWPRATRMRSGDSAERPKQAARRHIRRLSVGCGEMYVGFGTVRTSRIAESYQKRPALDIFRRWVSKYPIEWAQTRGVRVPYALDAIDRSIVSLLLEDGRISSAEITRRIGHVSERAVRYRIERLVRCL